ncbi:hypothetical protein LMG31884_22240 [Xanthomonas hydrangeae]|uniref:NAD(P)H-binding protein n=1 Tax=Xanthomonas hydrangeae TaxID=2775159 RepID=UPI001962D2A2|nr:hypothetical protein LMG31884_22240 [Xanthomonas hydrangeae]CAD7716559.1 hypothetical protein LMG31884_22240 [Xanthomonas hydrangeae]CAD7732017.1 hypothetical protein LMG31887_22230 [Xanthomonas hydrangeae]CAD7732020.1 hypothetical protein LMG31887_22230 [Xanthomonas hydrangeae]
MVKVLILGANGQIARVTTTLLLQNPDVRLTLYLRRADRLRSFPQERLISIVEADVLDEAALTAAMIGQDVVYANLAGALKQQAETIVRAMHAAGVARLIFVTSMGIYNEVPGERYGSVLDPYRDAAAVIEASGLDYTLLRPAWLNDKNEVAYATTRKGEPFEAANATVSRRSVADLVVRLATTPELELRQSLGVHRAVGAHPDM